MTDDEIRELRISLHAVIEPIIDDYLLTHSDRSEVVRVLADLALTYIRPCVIAEAEAMAPDGWEFGTIVEDDRTTFYWDIPDDGAYQRSFFDTGHDAIEFAKKYGP